MANDVKSREKVESRKSLESREKVESRKTSAAQLAANKRWNEKQSRMTFRMTPELREQMEQHASSRGESATRFIIRAIEEQIKRDELSQ